MDILYNLTARIPHLMQQSQLETSEGLSLLCIAQWGKNMANLVA